MKLPKAKQELLMVLKLVEIKVVLFLEISSRDTQRLRCHHVSACFSFQGSAFLYPFCPLPYTHCPIFCIDFGGLACELVHFHTHWCLACNKYMFVE